MKQRTGRKLLGVLLALVMVVGLVPGMGLTAYAETPVGFVALNENFDNGLGTWWVNTASPAYHFAADSGYVYADPNNGNEEAQTYCYSPMMDLSKAASATLVFKYKNPTDGGCDDFSVDYVVNNDSGTRVFTDASRLNTLHNSWQTQTITLPEGALAANVQIRFGATNWKEAKGIVTVKCPGNPELIVRMDDYGSNKPTCAIALLENVGGTFSVEKIVNFYYDSQEMDKDFDWGLQWTTGRKD